MSFRRTARAVALTAAALVLTVLPLGSVANAAATCSYNTTTKIMSVNLGAVSATTTVQRATSAAGAAIQVNGANCGTATVANTDIILISGNNNDHTLTFNLTNGPLAPGFTNEVSDPASSEIEVELGITGTGIHTVVIQAGAGDDVIRAGRSSAGDTRLNLNATETKKDADVTITDLGTGTRKLRVLGDGGLDTLGSHGGSGTGPEGTPPVEPYDLEGGDGNDKITVGGGGGQSLRGGLGDDELNNVGTTANLTLMGEDGNDVLRSGTAGTILDGGNGDDQMIGGSGNDTLTGGAGNDRGEGRSGNDSLNGGTENDALEPGLGVDSVNGGSGTDTVKYTTENGVNVNLTTGTKSGTDSDAISAVENVTGSPGVDTINGTTLVNKLVGGSNNDTITALDGDDILQGSGGDDSLSAGAGNDTVGGGAGDDFLDGGAGTDVCAGGPGTDNVQNCP
jgi:Ca2+-binding RTX toxin-like protein